MSNKDNNSRALLGFLVLVLYFTGIGALTEFIMPSVDLLDSYVLIPLAVIGIICFIAYLWQLLYAMCLVIGRAILVIKEESEDLDPKR